MRTLFAIILLLTTVAMSAQSSKPLKQRTARRGMYTEKYHVLASDTTVWEGDYSLIYKGNAIERGQYHKGERVGVWEFYNIHNLVEFYYDYDKQLPMQITPHSNNKMYSARSFPPLFLGSPLVPTHFIGQHSYFPQREKETYTDCKVVLALEINANGRMTGYHLAETSKEGFNEVILNAAAQIPKDWRWVPSRKDGRNVPGEYMITVIFEAVE